MEPYVIGFIVIGIIILLLFGAKYWPKRITNREAYNRDIAVKNSKSNTSSNTNSCGAMYPPGPTTVPPSAYAKLMAPSILTSENNPESAPTLHDSPKGGYTYNFYSDKFVCNTPWKMRAVNNDSCAQYGIGERAEGPPGEQFCVCEAKRKDGTKVETGTHITADNIVIGVGAVCTKDSQCCTKYCSGQPGQFSKMCQCPPGQAWDETNERCVGTYRPDPGAYSSMYDEHVEEYRRPPEGSIPSNGKLCASNKDCGLGEACTSNNFCASQLIDAMSGGPSALEHADNYFNIGANCQSSDQCANNMICKEETCQCPMPLIYEWSSRNCQCSDGALSFYNGQCVNSSTIPRTMCPSTPPAFARGWEDCGLGEIYVAGSHQCACVADLKTIHPGKIGPGGKCESSEQCSSGSCKNISGISVCVEPQTPVWDVAIGKYLN